MTTPRAVPGPRDGLDEGSLADLVRDGHEISGRTDGLDVAEAIPAFISSWGPSEVPDDACALIEGFAAYGS